MAHTGRCADDIEMSYLHHHVTQTLYAPIRRAVGMAKCGSPFIAVLTMVTYSM